MTTSLSKADKDDLFNSSTMTFGEHLEELRSCLIRAAIGLVCGVVIGFFVARPVIHIIESPLRKALGEYYTERAIETFDAWKPRRSDGPTLPYSRKEVVDAVEQYNLSFDLREVHPNRLPGSQIQEKHGDTFDLDSSRPSYSGNHLQETVESALQPSARKKRSGSILRHLSLLVLYLPALGSSTNYGLSLQPVCTRMKRMLCIFFCR